MKQCSIVILGLLLVPRLFAQSNTADTIRFSIVFWDHKSPCPGAIFSIKGTSIGTVSDVNGNAKLIVPANRNIVTIGLIDLYVELSIVRPVDSIHYDLGSQKAAYYFGNKKIRTRKQRIKSG